MEAYNATLTWVGFTHINTIEEAELRYNKGVDSGDVFNWISNLQVMKHMVTKYNYYGHLTIHWMIADGSFDIVEYLLQQKFPISNHDCDEVIGTGNMNLIRLLPCDIARVITEIYDQLQVNRVLDLNEQLKDHEMYKSFYELCVLCTV